MAVFFAIYFLDMWFSLAVEEEENPTFNPAPISDRERQDIESRVLGDLETESFYIAESDKEREEMAPSLSTADLAEIRTGIFQRLRRAPTIFSVTADMSGDWFTVRKTFFVVLFFTSASEENSPKFYRIEFQRT